MARDLTSLMPAQKLEAIRDLFRSLEQDLNKLMAADAGDYDTLVMEDALSVYEDAQATMAVEVTAFFDHVDEQHVERERRAAA